MAKFILTRELGRLVKWLRILGFDAAYFNQDKTSSLIIQALREERIIITRNHRLPKSGGIKILQINSQQIKEQIAQVLKALQISPASDMMFTRCLLCNEGLNSVSKEKIKDKVAEYVFNPDFAIAKSARRAA